MVGEGNAARPTIRIPYAERKPATGREILLVCRQAQPIRHALGSRFCRAGLFALRCIREILFRTVIIDKKYRYHLIETVDK